MNLTRYTSSRQLSYGEELALYRETGATPILDEAAPQWTYVLPGVVVSDEKIAEILAGAENIVEPPPFYEPFVLDEIFVERPRRYEPKMVGLDMGIDPDSDASEIATAKAEDLSKRVPGIDLDKINWVGSKPPSIPKRVLASIGVTAKQVSDVWANFPSPVERRSFFEIWIQCAD